MDLQTITDQTSYNLLLKRRPGLIEAIDRALAKGATAAIIEAYAFRKLGAQSLTAAVIAGAAHWMERTGLRGEARMKGLNS